MFLAGVGGQGSLSAQNIIGEAAVLAGVNVMSSEIHGMAQRGGVVVSSIVLGEAKSPLVDDGDADILLAFEPIEALRAGAKCSKKTVVVMNTQPMIPFTVGIGMQKYPPLEKTIEDIKKLAGKVYTLNAEELAKESGEVKTMSVVMLGALAGAFELPVTTEQFMEAIKMRVPKKFLAENKKAFELGQKAAKAQAS